MIKASSIFTFILLLTQFVFGQTQIDNAYLYRKLIEKDSFVRVPNTGVWFFKSSGLKKDHFGWLFSNEFEKADCNMFYFEMNTTDVPNGPWKEFAPGSFQIAINLPKGTKSLNFDTISKLRYQLINNYTGFDWKKTPTNTLTGILNITENDLGQTIIDGKINIDTKNPITEQKIIFENFKIQTLDLDEYIALEKREKEEKEKQEKKMWGAFDLVSKERGHFYDSIFNLKLFPNNKLVAQINRKSKFDFTLNNSYILINAMLTDSAKQDLSELLGGNILASIQGEKKVFVIHSFYDPVKNSIDDETNYSVSLQFDSLVIGKTYKLNNKSNDFIAKLAYWHYGPHGTVITSKKAIGTVSITENDNEKVAGTLNLKFNNVDKTRFTLDGSFELPKLKINDISDLENRIRIKLIKYYKDE